MQPGPFVPDSHFRDPRSFPGLPMIAAVPRGEVFLPDWIAGFSKAGIPRIITLFKLVFRFFRKKTKKSFEIHLTNEKFDV